MEPEKVSSVNDGESKQNLFGCSEYTISVICLILSTLFGAINGITSALAEAEGLSSNALTLYTYMAALIGGLIIDAYQYRVGYKDAT